MSTTQRRDILWNMADPGDPYDIKKSLIAKLPGDNKIFMGEHLELVLLFQGAEIERLIESLNDYKLKYKQLEKVELDRHSYEVQIKQLTEWCQSLEPLKGQNMRLKQFANRQTSEIQKLQKQLQGFDSDLNFKYEQALQKINTLFSENKNLQNQLNRSKTQNNALERSKHREFEDLKNSQIEKGLHHEREITDLKNKFNLQIMQLQGELKRYKEKLQNERLTVNDLRLNEQQHILQIEQYKNRLSASTTMQGKAREYNKKLEMLTAQKDRLQISLNQKNRENQQLKNQTDSKQLISRRYEGQIRQYQIRITQLQDDNYRLRNKMATQFSPQKNTGNLPNDTLTSRPQRARSELMKKINDYEQKLALTAQQNQRLSHIISTKNRKIQQLEREISIISNQKQLFVKQTDEKSYNPSPIKSDFPTETKKPDQLRQLKIRNQSLLREIESLKKEHQQELERGDIEIQSWKTEVQRLRTQKLALSSSRSKPGDSRPIQPRPPVSLPPQNPHLNDQTGVSSNNQVIELQRTINQKQRQIREYKQRITELKQINKYVNNQIPSPEQGSALVNVDQLKWKYQEMENKNISLNKQVEKLHNILRSKDEQYQRLSDQVGRLRNEVYKIPQTQNLANSKTDKALKQENQELRSRLVPWSQEISRLNFVLQNKINQLIQINNQNNTIRQDIFILERQLQQANYVIEQNKKEIIQLQRSINNNTQPIPNIPNVPGHHGSLPQISTQDPRVSRLTVENRRLEEQITRKNQQIQNLIIKQSQKPNVSQSQSQQEINTLKQEITRLTEIVQKSQLQQSQIINQNKQLQNSINFMKNQGGLSNQKTIQLQSTISELRIKNDQLSRQIQALSGSNINQSNLNIQIRQYQQKALMMSAELEKANSLMYKKQQEWNRLRLQLQNHINRLSIQDNQQGLASEANFRNQINESNRRISTLTNENDNLKRNLTNLEAQMVERTNQANKLVQELQKASFTINQYMEQIRSYEKTYEQFVPYKQQLESKVKEQHQLIQNGQHQIPKFATEIERLNVSLAQQVQKSEEFKRKLNESNAQYRQLVSQYQMVVNTANNHNQMRQQEIEFKMKQYEQKIHQLTRHIEQQQQGSQNLVIQLRESEGKMQSLSAEVDRLNNILKMRVQQYQILMGQLNNIKIQFNQRITDSETQKMQYQKLRNEFDRQINQLSSEIERLTHTYNHKIQEDKMGYIAEIERLNNTLRIKVQQSQEWQNKHQHLTRMYQQVTNVYNQLVPEYEASRNKMSQFQQKFNKLAEEFQRLSVIINTLKQQNYNLKVELRSHGNLQEMNRRLSSEIDRLNKIKEELEQDIGQLRIRYSDEAALHKRLNQQLSLFVVLFAEIESLRKRVKDKQKQVEEVRRSSLAPFRVG